MKPLSIALITLGALAALLAADAVMFSRVLLRRQSFEAAMAMSGIFYAVGCLATLMGTATSAILARRGEGDRSERWLLKLCVFLILVYIAILFMHPQPHR